MHAHSPPQTRRAMNSWTRKRVILVHEYMVRGRNEKDDGSFTFNQRFPLQRLVSRRTRSYIMPHAFAVAHWPDSWYVVSLTFWCNFEEAPTGPYPIIHNVTRAGHSYARSRSRTGPIIPKWATTAATWQVFSHLPARDR